MKGIIVDGYYYDVILTHGIERSFELKQGELGGVAQTGREIPDILGTNYIYTMTVEPNRDNMDAYNEFYEKISEPVESHVVELPYGVTTMKFEAMIMSGKDRLRRRDWRTLKWGSLEITFMPIEPQRTE